MIFEKRPGVWKSSTSSKIFTSAEAATAFEEAHQPSFPIIDSVKVVDSSLSPLEQHRGYKEPCEECNCEPCECEEEWNSVEETSSEIESSMEEIS
jgi:hypothetical protein